MYKRVVNWLYLLNIIFQSFLNLLMPIGFGLLVSYLLVAYAGAPSWVYAVFTVFGVFVGLFSMVKFILSAMAALDRLEKEQKARAMGKKTAKSGSDVARNEEGTPENEEK